MTTTPEVENEPEERPTIAALFGQLVDDSRSFAKAEVAYLRAQAGERASFALPGLAMIGGAIALSFGAIVAGLVSATIWLATLIPLGWALLTVTGLAGLLCFILIRAGVARLRGSLKSRETR
jgi:hypothetical protein